MKHGISRQKDIILLLTILVTMSFGIGMLHGDLVNPESQISTNDILRSLSPQLIATDIAKVADAISNLAIDKQLEVLRAIVGNPKSPLNRNQKLHLIFKVVARSFDESGKTKLLFPIHQYPFLQKGKSPILYRAALNGNEKIIPVLLPVLKKINENEMIKGLEYAIKVDNPKALQAMFANGVSVVPREATDLLWNVVEDNKKAEFVPILKEQKAFLNSAKKGRTLLVAAAERNNLSLVKALVEAGADINRIANNEVGSALQIAARKGFTDIDLYLRVEKGARE
jgi:ankyrin repeat protein